MRIGEDKPGSPGEAPRRFALGAILMIGAVAALPAAAALIAWLLRL